MTLEEYMVLARRAAGLGFSVPRLLVESAMGEVSAINTRVLSTDLMAIRRLLVTAAAQDPAVVEAMIARLDEWLDKAEAGAP